MTNTELINKFPFLSYSRSNGSYTKLDELPRGWKENFGIELCNKIVENVDDINKYKLINVGEHNHELIWEDNGYFTSVLSPIIESYKEKAKKTCSKCGQPLTKDRVKHHIIICKDCE